MIKKISYNVSPDYYPVVDFFRGLGAIVILIWHYHHFYFEKPYFGPTNGNPSWDFSRQPFYENLSLLYHHGYWAVQFFWILSGFVFAFVYLNRRISFKQFFILRFSRLYPLHFVTLILISAFQFLSFSLTGEFQILEINDFYHFILNLFYAQHWGLQNGYSFNSVTWSVSLEELVYYFFWLLVVFLGITSYRVWLIVVGVALFLTPDFGIYAWAFFYFFCGALFYICQSRGMPSFNFVLGILFVGVSLLCFYAHQNFFEILASFKNFEFVQTRSYVFHFGLYNFFIMFLFLSVIAFASSFDKTNILKGYNRIFLFFGSLTYSSYLIHLPMQVLILTIFESFALSRSYFDEPFTFFVFILTTLGVARVVYVWFERPWQTRIRARFAGQNA